LRLTVRTALAAILIGIVVSVVAFGYFMPYWRKADQDLALAYQGLLFNDGSAQSYFDHTGYIYFLAIGAWYDLLHIVGLLKVHALSALPPSSDTAAFDAAWTGLVRAGRVFSMTWLCALVLAFFFLTKRLMNDGRIAVLAALALALSGSYALHARMMRTELLSASFTALTLMCVLLAAQEERRTRQALLLAGAGLFGVLALETKVQALIPLMTFPFIALALGVRSDRHAHGGGGWGAAVVLALAAAFIGPAAASVLWRGLEAPGVSYAPLGWLPDGLYQGVIIAWPVAAMIAFALIWRRRVTDAGLAAVAAGLGAAVGVMALLIRFEPRNVAALTHPIEHMFQFASISHPEMVGATVTSGVLAHIGPALWEGVGSHAFFPNPTARPTLLIEWFAIVAAVFAWRKGATLPVLRVAALLVSAWAVDSAFALRGLKDAYLAYTDPLLILAGAVMLKEFPGLMVSPRARGWAIGLGCVSLLWAHVEPIKLTLSKRDQRAACEALPAYVPGIQFPFCKPPT
jgi:Dolichyl-phosphate-mannose-protein mannosyltransferase